MTTTRTSILEIRTRMDRTFVSFFNQLTFTRNRLYYSLKKNRSPQYSVSLKDIFKSNIELSQCKSECMKGIKWIPIFCEQEWNVKKPGEICLMYTTAGIL
jgi:hypothetical protein